MSALGTELCARLQRGTASCACLGNKRGAALLAETRARGIQHSAIGAANSSIIPTRRHPIAVASIVGTMVTSTTVPTPIVATKYSIKKTHANFSIYCLVPCPH